MREAVLYEQAEEQSAVGNFYEHRAGVLSIRWSMIGSSPRTWTRLRKKLLFHFLPGTFSFNGV